MENITSIAELKEAIQFLEVEKAMKGQQLKEHFNLTIDSFKPVNLLKSSFRDVVSSPHIIENIIGTALGLSTGYLSKKLVVGGSVNLIRRLLGSMVQIGVTNVVSQHPEGIKSIGQSLFQRIFRKKERVNAGEERVHEF